MFNFRNGNKQEVFDRLDCFVIGLRRKNIAVIVCGDFNIDVFRKNQLLEHYLQVHASIGFVQVVKQVTRVCETNQSCLDDFIIKIQTLGVEVLEDQCFSDHFPVLFEWHMRVSNEANKNLYRDFPIIKREVSKGSIVDVLNLYPIYFKRKRIATDETRVDH